MTDSTSPQHGDDPVADDIAERNPDSGDVTAGEAVLDEGKVSPDQDEVGEHHNAREDDAGTDEAGDNAEDREHAADERDDAAAPPPQGPAA
jgi:hypothetical protein